MSVQEGTSSKAAANWTGGPYEGVREAGLVTTCLREAPFSLRSPFGEGDPAKAERRWRSLRPDSGHAFSTLLSVKEDHVYCG
ncbi:hypothetical protein ACTRXD_02565 [Nitrospira sp. T9]|uniref:hypothetical protein n=1 Tax=unclassified Nitrospira TaxID=2652172 RepID=UPI003F97CB83